MNYFLSPGIGLCSLREFIVPVDQFAIWRQHRICSISDGKELKKHITQRYPSFLIFMSVLLSIELNVLFHSAANPVREALQNEAYHTLDFWLGIGIIVNIVVSVLSLIAIPTSWASKCAYDLLYRITKKIVLRNLSCYFFSGLGCQ